MLTLQQIKANPQDIVRRLAIKGFDGSDEINRLLALDDDRRAAQLNNDNLAAELNKAAAQIGALMKQGDKQQAEEAKKQVAQLKEQQKAIAEKLSEIETEMRNRLLNIPNVPCNMVPEGKTAADNVVEKTGGQMPQLPDDALPHWELAKKYNIIDFDLGV